MSDVRRSERSYGWIVVLAAAVIVAMGLGAR